MAFSRKKLKHLGLKNVTAERLSLDKTLHYAILKRELKRILAKIEFCDLTFNYSKILDDGERLDDNKIKDYIFAMSKDYNIFLDYIKTEKGEKEYKKEEKVKKSIIKNMQPFLTNEHINELKSKFTEVIYLVSDKKMPKE